MIVDGCVLLRVLTMFILIAIYVQLFLLMFGDYFKKSALIAVR